MKEKMMINTVEKLTEEHLDEIFKGKRPEDVDFELYKDIRRSFRKALNKHLKGKFMFISNTPEIIESEDGKKEFNYDKRYTKTYIKEKKDDLY